MSKVSSKNQITIPVTALREAGIAAGDEVSIEAAGDGEVRVRRGALSFEQALGALSGTYTHGYLAWLDRDPGPLKNTDGVGRSGP